MSFHFTFNTLSLSEDNIPGLFLSCIHGATPWYPSSILIIFFLPVNSRAIITAKLVASPPFLPNKAQSAISTISTNLVAKSTITGEARLTVLPCLEDELKASSTSGWL